MNRRPINDGMVQRTKHQLLPDDDVLLSKLSNCSLEIVRKVLAGEDHPDGVVQRRIQRNAVQLAELREVMRIMGFKG